MNSVYSFVESERINSRFRIGTVTPVRMEVLHAKDVRLIASGREYIHSVFHLQDLSATIVVRSTIDEESLPQFVYRGGAVGVVPIIKNPYIEKCRALGMLFRHDREKFYEIACEVLMEASVEEKYVIYREFATELEAAPAHLLSAILGSIGPYLKTFRRANKREQVVRLGTRLRANWVDPDLRLLLACLISDFRPEDIVDCVEMETNKSFPTVVDNWVEKLVGSKNISECEILALKCMLNGLDTVKDRNIVGKCMDMADSALCRLFLAKYRAMDGAGEFSTTK